MINYRKLLANVLGVGLLTSCSTFASDIYIITLNDEFNDLNKNQAKMIYRGKSTTLAGNKVELLDLPPESNTRKTFYSTLLRKNASQMNSQWASLAFSGKTTSPEEIKVDDFSQVVEWLKNNPNGVAYFSLPDKPSDVKILYKLEVK
ncbi:hypothetical protein BCU68_11565 [Vibrio sp. 10N.286.49.B3]|uniref:hypothetical protein n=1 Tax=Vibrio sp. 10N.286.49.B3 TaxID=1880855 RepID=UPI000C852376|nr:hypothetical protein [Vibrio sp. 10N.286.49.B3]PMH44939.1 hypothetical protein BCU68_11565 [Vibrio sp. 10N.286.49.B3]